MRIIALTLVVVLMTFCMEVVAQAPSEPEPSASELRKIMADLKAELEATKAETKALIADKVKEKNAQLQKSLIASRKRQAYLATLIVERGEVQVKIKEVQAVVWDDPSLEFLLQRNAELEGKIKKANRTFACRFLHLGCIKLGK